jgi:PAS domain S-box-containing protein
MHPLADTSAVHRLAQVRDREFARRLFQHLPGAIFQVLYHYDGTYGLSYLSIDGVRLLGISVDQVEQIDLLAVIHPEDRHRFGQGAQRSADTGDTWHWEGRIRRGHPEVATVVDGGDTDYCWVRWAATPEHHANGTVIWDGMWMDITDTKQSQLKLRAERDRLVELSLDLLVAIGPDGQFRQVSPSVTDILGYAPAEFVTKTWRDLVHPDDAAATAQEFSGHLASGEPTLRFENRYRTRSGDYRWLSWHMTPLPEEGSFYGSARDVTEAKRRDRELMRYKRAVDSASDAIAILDTAGNPVYHNAAFARLYGVLSVAEFAALGGLRSVFPDPEQATMILNHTAQGKAWNGEVDQHLSNGQTIQVFLRAAAIRDAEDRIMGSTLMATDVTLKRQAQQERQRLTALVENSTDFVAISSLEGKPLYLNAAGLALVGLGDVSLAETVLDFFCAEDRPIAAELIYPLLLHEQRWDGEFRLRDFRTDTGISVDFTMFVVHHPDTHDPMCLATVARDIRDRKATEAALQASEAALRQKTEHLEATLTTLKQTQTQLVHQEKMVGLGQITAGIAHEINNPISFIYGNLSHVENYTRDLLALVKAYQAYLPLTEQPELQALAETMDLIFVEQDLPKLLQSMKVGGDRIKSTVRALQTFSRMDESDLKSVDLHACLDSALALLTHRLTQGRSRIRVVRDYGRLPAVECFAGQLNQVFMNIVLNAIDALEGEGATCCPVTGRSQRPQITLTTRVVGSDRVQVQIADNGPGIPPDILQRLFDPFFTTKAVGKGTGLGLSIGYQIVTQQHRGSLVCRSVPGNGTLFEIEVPVRQLGRATVVAMKSA